MANQAYPKWLEAQASANPVAFLTDTIRAAILSSAYTFSTAHQFFSDLTGVLGHADLANKTCANGVLDADDTVVAGVLASPGHIVVVYKWTGTGTTSQLMLYFDQGVGFDQTPIGDTTIVWPGDANIKIFPLGGTV